jgi:hypothetical protein
LATELHWQSLYNRLRDHGQKGLAIEALSAADDLKDIGVTLVGHRRKLLASIAAPSPAAIRVSCGARSRRSGEAAVHQNQLFAL